MYLQLPARNNDSIIMLYLLLIITLLLANVQSFCPSHPSCRASRTVALPMLEAEGADDCVFFSSVSDMPDLPNMPDDVVQLFALTREVLAEADVLIQQENDLELETDDATPFFCASQPDSDRDDASVDEIELTTLSEENDNSDMRALAEIATESTTTEKKALSPRQLSERNVAVSLFNLRRSLHNEDYQKIFDKRNYMIGEDQ
jgi:hypothetical protein